MQAQGYWTPLVILSETRFLTWFIPTYMYAFGNKSLELVIKVAFERNNTLVALLCVLSVA